MHNQIPGAASLKLMLEFDARGSCADGAHGSAAADDRIADDAIVDCVGREDGDDVLGLDIEGAQC